MHQFTGSLYSKLQTHIKVYLYLALIRHLVFWQKDRALLHATAVTRGWNGYRNKSQHRKLTMGGEENSPAAVPVPGLEPEVFQSRVRRSTIELSSLSI